MMKRILLLYTITILFSRSVIAQTNDQTKRYIDDYKELAINEEIRTGVPAAITLAQGILESQSGMSKLSIGSNNHFGIKCKTDWKGETYNYDDDARQECFRKYATAEDSYHDHSDFLRTRPNYASLFTLDPADCSAWAHGLKKAGYATNPIYARTLLKIIDDNGLQQYTLMALQHIKDGTKEDVAANINIGDKAISNDPLPTETVDAIPEDTVPLQLEVAYEAGDFPPGVFTINQAKVIYATVGTSLFALANNHNIAYAKMLEFNDLEKVDILTKAQLIFLEKKPKKSNTRDFHLVEKAETIETIAQVEGVQLESLFEYNKMQKGLQPAMGEKVYLRPGSPEYYPKLVKSDSK